MGTDSQAKPVDPINLPNPIVLKPEMPEVAPEATKPHKVDVGGKHTYLTRAFFREYGFTPGCPACGVMERTFGPAKGMSHTQACRARVEKEIEDDPCKRGKLEEDRKRAEERDRALPDDKRPKKLRFAENLEIVEIPSRDRAHRQIESTQRLSRTRREIGSSQNCLNRI